MTPAAREPDPDNRRGALSETEMAYIARCQCGCGSVTFATIDRPEWAKDTAKTIAKMIREGYVIERATLDSFRMSRCKRQADFLKSDRVTPPPPPRERS